MWADLGSARWSLQGKTQIGREVRHRRTKSPEYGLLLVAGRRDSLQNSSMANSRQASTKGARERGSEMGDVTGLLRQAAADDRGAIDELFALLYNDVHRIARARLAANRPITLLETTGLAHEAYLRLRNAARIDVESRAQLMAYISQVLRSIIVDFARKRSAERRGGKHVHVTLNDELADSVAETDADVEHIADALEVLESTDPRLKKVVEMRYFGGMTDSEIAEALGVTPRTVGRDWERARLLLSVALKR